MISTWITIASLLGVIALVAGVFFLERYLKLRARKNLMRQPTPDAWPPTLEKNFPLYRLIPQDIKSHLHQYMHVFLAEKSYEGCGGLEITEEIRVSIAAQACLLLLNNRGNFYPNLRSILVYPDEYINRRGLILRSDHDERDERVLIGESWHSGSVVLSWKHVRQGARIIDDGLNVVFHEFAHQLDQVSGNTDGTPELSSSERYGAWSATMKSAYERFNRRIDRGQRTLFDEYGATNPAEFFAVATETFFEKARRMKKEYPDLYQEFVNFYQLDPASWRPPDVEA
ncbi:MAG: M90 family metallopeptidase [Verrucomicrobiota bacterium]